MFVSLRYIPEQGSNRKSNEFLTSAGPSIAEEEYAKLNPEERRTMESRYQEAFDKLNGCMAQIPHQLVLVLRNMNTVWAITRGHRTGVDRYTLMARSAAEGQFRSRDSSVLQALRGYWSRLQFDFKLWSHAAQVKILRCSISVLRFFGVLPYFWIN